MTRFIRRWWWLGAVVLAAAAPVAWYLASPLFFDRIVAEEFQAGGQELARGTFTDADSFHKGSGTARIVTLAVGTEVRFESFEVTNGPDLYVYLAVHPQPRSRQDVDQGVLNLGRLKGNIGSQTYMIPEGTDLARYRSVVIYCRAFHVVFSTATLAAP